MQSQLPVARAAARGLPAPVPWYDGIAVREGLNAVAATREDFSWVSDRGAPRWTAIPLQSARSGIAVNRVKWSGLFRPRLERNCPSGFEAHGWAVTTWPTRSELE
jgi:hypothetical protein